MWRRLTPIFSALLFCASAWVVVREVRHLGIHTVASSLALVRMAPLGVAILLTASNYLVLTLHDWLALRYAGLRLPWRLAGLASFVGYAVSNNVGFALVSGTSARYRFYSRWGLTAGALSRVVLFYSVTFWLGLCAIGGAALLLSPPEMLQSAGLTLTARAAGVLALLLVGSYAVLCLFRREPLRLSNFTIPVPSAPIMAGQLAISSVDWLLAAAILYSLLPEPRPPFLTIAGIVTLAHLGGVASHVPGGLGVFEGIVLFTLGGMVPSEALIAALVAYRVVYFLLPLAVALGILLVDELMQRRGRLTQFGRTCTALAAWAAPLGLSVITFAAGTVLLFSGATPAVPERLAWLARMMPLPLVEASHFTASLTGLVLLLLAKGIADRVDAAYYITSVALVVGAAASLLKGADWEEASILVMVLFALLAARRHFTRRAGAFATPLSPRWLAAVGTVVAASLWLGRFAYQHVDYTHDLWWRFAFDAEAPRALRASVAVVIVAFAVSVRQLMRPARPHALLVTEADLVDVDRIVSRQPRSSAALVYLGDKSLLWNTERTAFLMYAMRGHTCVAMGDPVGPRDAAAGLVRQFLVMCDRVGLTPVFYEVSADHLPDYADQGMTAVKIGEEARVRLEQFSLVGSANKALRSTLSRMSREGFTFRVVDTPQVGPLIGELAEVSDEWLAAKNAAEKGFSLGYFDETYVARFPIAVIERNGRIEAFANLWAGPGRVEVAPDLMRYRTSAPPGVMDALFAHLILWARDQQYVWFNLGMAPLAGLSGAPTDRWSRLGHFVYRHGEAFYNFRGLRAYKDKFAPVWEPRYLVHPGGLALPRIAADVAALIGGGYTRLLRRNVRRAA
jgi:phosphatidylglycerol lysyltransferase